jgi:hypothetical protein
MLGFVLVAIVVVWVNRKSMLARGTGATDVLMPRADQVPALPGRGAA